jgi:hypothetical protein
MRVGKRGISAIVATVMIMLITVAAVTIVWSVLIPMINDNMNLEGESVQLDVVGESGYTAYDPNSGLVSVQVERGSDDETIDEIEIIISFEGTTVITTVPAPEPGQLRTYTINVASQVAIYGEPYSVTVAPIYLGGEVGSASSSEEIPEGTVQDDGEVYHPEGGSGSLPLGPFENVCSSLNNNVTSIISYLHQDPTTNIILEEGAQLREDDYFVISNNGGKVLKVRQIYNFTGSDYSKDTVKFQDYITDIVYSVIFTSEGHGQVIINGKTYLVDFYGGWDSELNYITVRRALSNNETETYYCGDIQVEDMCDSLDFINVTATIAYLHQDPTTNIILEEGAQLREDDFFVISPDGGEILEVIQIYNFTGSDYSKDQVKFKNYFHGDIYSVEFTSEGHGNVNINGRAYLVDLYGGWDDELNYITVNKYPYNVTETFYCGGDVSEPSDCTLGPELILNGNFNDWNGWEFGDSWNMSDGVAKKMVDSYGKLKQNINLQAGKTYRVEWDYLSGGGYVFPELGGSGASVKVLRDKPGHYLSDLTALAGNSYFALSAEGSRASTSTHDKISLREVIGELTTPELVTNGNFDNGSSGWTVGNGIIVSSENARLNVFSGFLSQDIGAEAGKLYQVSLTATRLYGVNLYVGIGDNVFRVKNGEQSFLITADNNGDDLVIYNDGGLSGAYAFVDDVRVREDTCGGSVDEIPTELTLKVIQIYNQTGSNPSMDRIRFLRSDGVIYEATITSEGIANLNYLGISYDLTYTGSTITLNNQIYSEEDVIDLSSNVSICTDTDGGIDYDVRGTISVNGLYVTRDSCHNITAPCEDGQICQRLQEFHCVGSEYFLTNYDDCPNGCLDGGCVEDGCIRDEMQIKQITEGTTVNLVDIYFNVVDVSINPTHTIVVYDSSLGNGTMSLSENYTYSDTIYGYYNNSSYTAQLVTATSTTATIAVTKEGTC